MTWIIYGLGIVGAFGVGWGLRGLWDEDRAIVTANERVAAEAEASRAWVKPPRDYPYP